MRVPARASIHGPIRAPVTPIQMTIEASALLEGDQNLISPSMDSEQAVTPCEAHPAPLNTTRNTALAQSPSGMMPRSVLHA